MAIGIDYESEDFPSGSGVTNGTAKLDTSWGELLWSALTVGRPNRHHVFRHAKSSAYEALFRLSLIRMTLEQRGRVARYLRRTGAARTLDPTEKGAVSYFLGLAVCKLFAARLLDAPWLLHLDVFRPALNPVLRGRSRPDLVGQTMDGRWVALECKGRGSTPDVHAKDKAKQQALRLVRVDGTAPAFQIGGIAYFKNEVLQFFWRDPEGESDHWKPISVDIEPHHWQHYYAPVLGLLRSQPDAFDRLLHEPSLMPVHDADLKLGVHPKVLRALTESRWLEARDVAMQLDFDGMDIPYMADGLAVVAGKSWTEPLVEPESTDG